MRASSIGVAVTAGVAGALSCRWAQVKAEAARGGLDHRGHEVFGLYSVGKRQPLCDVK